MNPEINSAMNPEFDDVLLTAYLDNEVTEVERAQVEEQLRVSESSRTMLEELRSVRNLVVLLHLSQPSRSFQHGPWSETPEAVTATTGMLNDRVVLNNSRPGWNVTYQRLASIAALIAIASCVGVLVFGPNSGSMSLTENPKNSTRRVVPALPTGNAVEDANVDFYGVAPTPTLDALQSSQPSAKSQPMQADANDFPSNESFGRAELSSRT